MKLAACDGKSLCAECDILHKFITFSDYNHVTLFHCLLFEIRSEVENRHFSAGNKMNE
jgi:hypothetical protein